MKINVQESKTCKFSEVDNGTVFAYDNDFYMKTLDYGHGVDLTDGSMVGFEQDDMVIIVDCELVVK